MNAGIALLAAAALLGAVPAPAETFSHGRFDDVQVLRPAGMPRQFVALISGREGWTAAMQERAQALAGLGALVAGIDLAKLRRRLAGDACVFPDGDVENLAHHLQGYLHLPTYLRPVLAGAGEGSAWAYALAAQAGDGVFGGVLGFGFCPQLDSGQPLCKGDGIHFRRVSPQQLQLLPAARLPVPWTVLETAPAECPAAAARAFVESVGNGRWMARPAAGADDRLSTTLDRLDAANPPTAPAAPASLADLPLIEIPSPQPGPRFVVLLSGDGGWAAIDKALAAAFARRGLSVVGFDSLRYFWTRRTPESLAADLDRVLRFYAGRWQRREAALVGYSQGADVLPFAINRLPPASRALLRYTVLLGLGRKAAFEFHLSNWLGPSGDHPIAPEARRLDGTRTLCVHGTEERDSLCPELTPAQAQSVALKGDHHFGGDYEALATLILDRMNTR